MTSSDADTIRRTNLPPPDFDTDTIILPSSPQEEEKKVEFQPWFRRDPEERITFPLRERLIFYLGIASIGSAVIGGYPSARMAGYVYRAENAHRMPTTPQGWYFYHRTKNHIKILGFYKGAVKALPLGLFTVGTIIGTEEMLDQWRGGGDQKDFLSSLGAVAGVGGLFGLWRRYTIAEWARESRKLFFAGLFWGLSQDHLGASSGRKIAIWDWIRDWHNGRTRADSEEE